MGKKSSRKKRKEIKVVEKHRVNQDWQKWLYFLAWIYTLIFILVPLKSYITLEDEGIVAMDAWRIAQGQVPYRDFFEIIPPISFYPSTLLIRFFGPSIWAVQFPIILIGILLLWTVDKILKKTGTSIYLRSIALILLGQWGIYFWPFPSHHWYATLFQVLSILFLLKAFETEAKRALWIMGAGALSALEVLSLQDQGGYFIVLLPILFLFWPESWKKRGVAFAGWAIGGIIAGVPIMWGILSKVPFSELWFQWVYFPMHQYHSIASQPWVFLESLTTDLQAGFSLSLVCRLLLALAPLLSFLCLLSAFVEKAKPRYTWVLLSLSFLAGVGGVLHRIAETNIGWCTPIFLIPIFAYISLRLRVVSGFKNRAIHVVLSILLLVLSLSGLYLLLMYSLSKTLPIRTSAGTLYTYSLVEVYGSKGDLELIQAVEDKIPKDVPLFVAGYIPYLPYLTHHMNSTPFNFFITYNTGSQAEQVVLALKKYPSTWVVVPRGNSGFGVLDTYLRAHYKVVWMNETYLIASPK